MADYNVSCSAAAQLAAALTEALVLVPYHEHTHGDALGLFLTGAESDGGSQNDPDVSLGGFRSSTRVEPAGFFVSGPLRGIKVERIAAANGPGHGCLESVDGNYLRWTAPGGTPGRAIPIVNGSTRLLESGRALGSPYRFEHNKFAVVSRHTAEELAGSATVTLVPIFNSVVGSSNVSGAEQQAGEVKLRCIALKATHALKGVTNLKVWVKTLGTWLLSNVAQLPESGPGTIETSGSFADWPQRGFCHITDLDDETREIVYYSSRTATALLVPAGGRGLLGTAAAAGAASDGVHSAPGIALAKESPVEGVFTLAADENDTEAVSGLEWNTSIFQSGGVNIGRLDAGQMCGLWVWLLVVAGQDASPALENCIAFVFDAE